MRSRYILILILFVFINSYSQEFLPLLDTNKKWSTVDEYFRLLDMGPIRSHHYYLNGDTIIENKSFFKIHKIDDYYSTDDLYGFIREDTTHQVFFRNLKNEEGLMYDFNISINDTIDIYFQGYKTDSKALVKEFGIYNDSLLSRRTILLQGVEMWSETETWIEGIGSNEGFLESGATLSGIVGGMFELLCFHENDTLKYLNPRFSDCSWPNYVGLEQNKFDENKILIFPNPVVSTASFKILDPESDFYVIEFFDSSGKMIYKKQLSFSNTFIIKKSDFVEGTILYRVRAEDEIITGSFQVH